jgi:hypothetical protein
MSTFLLDTDTVSLIQFGHAAVLARVASHADVDLCLGVITLQEQMQGWLARFSRPLTPPQLADWHDRMVNRIFPVWRRYALISFTEPAILRFEHLRSLR